MAPWFAELGIRSKLWVVPKMGHAIPSAEVMAEQCTRLAEVASLDAVTLQVVPPVRIPLATVSLILVAHVSRMVRSETIDVLNSDYIRAARLKSFMPNCRPRCAGRPTTTTISWNSRRSSMPWR